MRPTRNGFRPDIQGLRAIAVGVVVVAHVQVGLLPGGYVGVDVFLVISGFLITGLMLREVDRTGRLSLSGFYARRARRILPAATLVLVATAVASALWLGPVLAPETFVSVVWAAAFVSNIRFAQQDTDYFSADLPPSPAQHFWSLSVEEQFYVVWPLLVVLALLAVRRRAPRATLATVLGGVIAVSLAWSVHLSSTEPSAAYFSSLTRAWELAVGALAAVLLSAWSERRSAPPGRGVLEVTTLAGAVAILAACVGFDSGTAFPGYAAALPVLGTVAILVAGGLDGPTSVVGRLLSVRPMQLVGDWSYSIYLWHWPLLIVPVLHLGRPLQLGEKLVLVALTFAFAGVTVHLVERPFRSQRRWTAFPRRALALYPVTAALVASSAYGAHAYVEHHENRKGGPAITLPRDWQDEYDVTDPAAALVKASAQATRRGEEVPRDLRPRLSELRDSTADTTDCDYRDDTVRRLCPQGDRDADQTLVLLGDSHARHWIPAFDRIADDAGYRAYYLVKPQCVPASVTMLRVADGEPFRECDDFKAWALDQVDRLQPDLVVVSTSPGSRRGVYERGELVTETDRADQLVESGMVRLLRRVDAASRRTALLLDIPNVAGDPGTCLARGRPRLAACSFPEQQSHADAVALQDRAAARAGVHAIPTRQWFCDGDTCPPVVGRTVPYRDGGHMTTEYAATLADSLARRLGLRPG